MTTNEQHRPIDPQVRIGHVHLKVADLNGLLKEVEAATDAPKVDEGPRDL